MKNLVTVIIPTFNRFKFLVNAIDSVNLQNANDIKIIVINDGSTDKRYYEAKFPKNVYKIDLNPNQKKINGFSSDAIRNIGIDIVDTKYIAFLDDDDYWLEGKLEVQVDIMEKNNLNISSTDGYIGEGVYNPNTNYQKYLNEYYFKTISEKYKESIFHQKKLLKNKFQLPSKFNFEFICIHNCIVTSSVIVKTEEIKKVGMFDKRLPNGVGDYECWKKILRNSENYFISEPLFYYDNNHGFGQEYKQANL